MPSPIVPISTEYPWFIGVGELPTGEATPFDATSDKMRRDYKREFLVECRYVLTDPMLACFAPGIPRPFVPYITSSAIDIRSLVVKLSSKRMEDRDITPVYKVTVMYSTELPKQVFDYGQPKSDRSPGQGPEDEPPDINWDYEEVPSSQPYDLDGKYYLNSALQPILNPPKREGSRAILVYTRNELNFDAVRAATYANTANSKEIAGRPVGSLLNMAPKAVSKYKGAAAYYRVTYRIKFGMRINFVVNETVNENGSVNGEIQDYEDFRYHYEVDQGFAELVPMFEADGVTPILFPGTGKVNQRYQWVNIKDAKHQPLHKPALLDGKGRKLKFDYNDNGVPLIQRPYIQKFRIRESTDFSEFLTQGF